jgi:hypothetical protein
MTGSTMGASNGTTVAATWQEEQLPLAGSPDGPESAGPPDVPVTVRSLAADVATVVLPCAMRIRYW